MWLNEWMNVPILNIKERDKHVLYTCIDMLVQLILNEKKWSNQNIISILRIAHFFFKWCEIVFFSQLFQLDSLLDYSDNLAFFSLNNNVSFWNSRLVAEDWWKLSHRILKNLRSTYLGWRKYEELIQKYVCCYVSNLLKVITF